MRAKPRTTPILGNDAGAGHLPPSPRSRATSVAGRTAVRLLLAPGLLLCSTPHVAAAVLGSLAPFLINHYTFDDPVGGDPLSAVELDFGLDATDIQLLNGAPRVLDGAWWGSQYALETRQNNTGPNDDWKAGVMFLSSAESTLSGTASVTGITIMGWFQPLGTIDDNPSPNTNTPDNPDDFYNAFGLAGLLRGDGLVGSLDGHAVRALIEVIDGKVTGLGRRRDSQSGNGSRKSLDDWYLVMPPGDWTHLAAAFNFDEGTIDLYKNGLPLAASDADTESWNVTSGTNRTSNTAAGGIKIGGSHPNNSAEQNPFNGRIDELMFFNKWLSPADVEAQFRLVSNIPGDYNRNGAVDAADYTVWRDTLNAIGFGLAADGNDNQQIDADDYTIWANAFAAVGDGAALTATSAPEPSAATLALAAIAVLIAPRTAARRPR
jgi:hypothetical protein